MPARLLRRAYRWKPLPTAPDEVTHEARVPYRRTRRHGVRSRAKDSRKPDDSFCIEQTGSRITAARNARSRSDQKECVAAGGRVYTREDIERSGSPDLRDALRRLDPSLR